MAPNLCATSARTSGWWSTASFTTTARSGEGCKRGGTGSGREATASCSCTCTRSMAPHVCAGFEASLRSCCGTRARVGRCLAVIASASNLFAGQSTPKAPCTPPQRPRRSGPQACPGPLICEPCITARTCTTRSPPRPCSRASTRSHQDTPWRSMWRTRPSPRNSRSTGTSTTRASLTACRRKTPSKPSGNCSKRPCACA